MIVNEAALALAFKGFKTVVTTAMLEAPSVAKHLAMTVPSGSRDETYGWLGQFPQFREWTSGDRLIRDIGAHGFTIQNRKFENTISIKRDDFADDRLGIFKPLMAEMGYAAAMHPDELIFKLLSQGDATLCYDGQNFFDTDHPTQDEDGNIVTVSNYNDGGATPGPAWYLLDTSRQVRPVIWQEREKYEFTTIMDKNDHGVFMTDTYLYGIRARVNAGFGLWQLAYRSHAPLTDTNYADARKAMMELRGDQGRDLGVRPNLLVVPPALEAAGRRVVVGNLTGGGDSNIWAGSAELIVTPSLTA